MRKRVGERFSGVGGGAQGKRAATDRVCGVPFGDVKMFWHGSW